MVAWARRPPARLTNQDPCSQCRRGRKDAPVASLRPPLAGQAGGRGPALARSPPSARSRKKGDILIADRAYDTNAIRATVTERGAWANNPTEVHPQRHVPVQPHGSTDSGTSSSVLQSKSSTSAGLGNPVRPLARNFLAALKARCDPDMACCEKMSPHPKAGERYRVASEAEGHGEARRDLNAIARRCHGIRRVPAGEREGSPRPNAVRNSARLGEEIGRLQWQVPPCRRCNMTKSPKSRGSGEQHAGECPRNDGAQHEERDEPRRDPAEDRDDGQAPEADRSASKRPP